MSGHSHGHHDLAVSQRTERRLLLAVAPFAVATVVGLLLLWPSGTPENLGPPGAPVEQYRAEVVAKDIEPCETLPGQESFECSTIEASIEEGPEAGDTTSFSLSEGSGVGKMEVGDRILVSRSEDETGRVTYFFVDYERRTSLIVLAVAFAAVVLLLSRWRGLAALVGLALSLLVLTMFVLPAILEGSSPLLVAIVGGAAVMFVALYLAHGFNARTTTAVLGTLASLTLTALLALVFVEASRFTGFGSEEATFLQISAQQVNLEGLLLGGIIIGTLGVLDDVTVTQASAGWELRLANPVLGAGELYRRALRIGRDHIASTVNTLVLAYAGASLPLLILFSLSNRPLGSILTSEVVAEEIVRTLVGSIGLVASVPITTGLAAMVASRDAVTGGHDGSPPTRPERGRKRSKERRGYRRPRAEAEWRSEEPTTGP
ncbi:MAG TPA: YibE/F family protein [Actinomycetota bacterium]|nr:YibE/F family protein [Actinomycetota bacterium]